MKEKKEEKWFDNWDSVEVRERYYKKKEKEGKEVNWDELHRKLKEKGTKNFLKLEEGKMYELQFLKDKPTLKFFTTPEGKEALSREFEVLYEEQKRIFSVTSIKLLRKLNGIREINGGTLEGVKVKIRKEGAGLGTIYRVFVGAK